MHIAFQYHVVKAMIEVCAMYLQGVYWLEKVWVALQENGSLIWLFYKSGI